MGRIGVAALAASLLLLAVACGERREPTGPTVQLYPVTVQDARDQRLVVQAPPSRIVALDDGASMIVRALGRRAAGGVITNAGNLDIARLRRLHPDLIVATETGGEEDLSRAAQATKAPVYLAPADSVKGLEHAVTQLGLVLGRPVAARNLVRTIEQKRERVERTLRNAPPVSVFVDTGYFTTVSDQSLTGDLIRIAHGRNVAGSTPGSAPFDLDELRRTNPDVYLATSDANVTLADLRKDPRTRALRAVRSGRFATIDENLLVAGPHVGDALLQIARLLHPDAFR
jgi:iron complex transport system substrate-binding protein